MATTTNFGWETPDDTDLVKDGAASIRTLGSAIDTSLVDLKGGTTGQVLSKASNTDLDYSWVTSGGAADYTLLNAGGTALTGAATITVSGISSKNSLLVYVVGAGTSSGSYPNFYFRFNSDSGSNYAVTGIDLNKGDYAKLDGWFNNTNSTSITAFTLKDDTRTGGSALWINGCNSTGKKIYSMMSAAQTSEDSANYAQGFYNGSSTISSVTFGVDQGNLDAGTIYVYGSAN